MARKYVPSTDYNAFVHQTNISMVEGRRISTGVPWNAKAVMVPVGRQLKLDK